MVIDLADNVFGNTDQQTVANNSVSVRKTLETWNRPSNMIYIGAIFLYFHDLHLMSDTF